MSAPSRGRLLAWAALGVVFVAVLGYGSLSEGATRTPDERVFDLSEGLKCPQCVGQSVAESENTISVQMRAEIRRQVDAGRSDEEIRAYFASRYGDEVLLTPPTSGVNALVWVLPVVLGGGAVAGLAVAFARWRRSHGAVEATDDDRRLVEAARAAAPPGDVGVVVDDPQRVGEGTGR